MKGFTYTGLSALVFAINNKGTILRDLDGDGFSYNPDSEEACEDGFVFVYKGNDCEPNKEYVDKYVVQIGTIFLVDEEYEVI